MGWDGGGGVHRRATLQRTGVTGIVHATALTRTCVTRPRYAPADPSRRFRASRLNMLPMKNVATLDVSVMTLYGIVKSGVGTSTCRAGTGGVHEQPYSMRKLTKRLADPWQRPTHQHWRRVVRVKVSWVQARRPPRRGRQVKPARRVRRVRLHRQEGEVILHGHV